MNLRTSIIAVGVGALIGCPAAFAQDAEIKRQIMQRSDVPGTAYETVLGIAELPSGMSIGKHTHLGVEVGYVAQGELELMIDGQAPIRLKAGDSYLVPAGAAHDAKSIGNVPGRAVATWVVEKGKPLSQPAP